MEVSCIGLDIHDAGDSLSDHNVPTTVPLPHLEYSTGPCIRHIQVVYKIDIAALQAVAYVTKIH